MMAIMVQDFLINFYYQILLVLIIHLKSVDMHVMNLPLQMFFEIYDINEEFLNKYISNLKYFLLEKYFNEIFNNEWNNFSR